jgi:dTDP-glucose pyrophosphorylase
MSEEIKPTLVVLAAGMGSRYGGLKQIDPIGPSGEVVLDSSVFDAIRAGFGKVVFIIRKDIEADFRDALEAHYTGRIEVEYAFQDLMDLPQGYALPEGRTKPWGTTHAMLACRDLVNEPFAVINADDFYGRQSFQVLGDWLRAHTASENVYSLVGFILAKTLSEHGSVSRGICSASNGLLVDVEECYEIQRTAEGPIQARRRAGVTTVTGDEPVSMNMWGFTPDVFRYMTDNFTDFLDGMADPMKAEYLIPSIVQELIENGKVTVDVLNSTEQWFGVTYPEDKPAVVKSVRTLIEDGVYPESLWA